MFIIHLGSYISLFFVERHSPSPRLLSVFFWMYLFTKRFPNLLVAILKPLHFPLDIFHRIFKNQSPPSSRGHFPKRRCTFPRTRRAASHRRDASRCRKSWYDPHRRVGRIHGDPLNLNPAVDIIFVWKKNVEKNDDAFI